MIKNSISTSASAAFVNIAYAWWLAHWLAAQCTVFWIRTAAEYEKRLDLPTWAVAHWRLAGAGALHTGRLRLDCALAAAVGGGRTGGGGEEGGGGVPGGRRTADGGSVWRLRGCASGSLAAGASLLVKGPLRPNNS
jgi:hypothetical protein